MSLKTKLIAASVFICVFFMGIFMFAVTYTIAKQNKAAAYKRIQDSSHLINEDIAIKGKKLLSAARQLSSMEGVGLKIKYITRYKSKLIPRLTRTTYQNLAEMAYNTNIIASDVWKTMIYDIDGDLIAFSITNKETAELGYVQGYPDPEFQTVSLKSGESYEDKDKYESWNRIETFENINIKFTGRIPKQEIIRFEEIDQNFCLVAYMPVMGLKYNNTSQKMESELIGCIKSIQPLNDEFIEYMAKLTGMQINIFSTNGLTAGTLSHYTKLNETKINNKTLTLNEIFIKGIGYYQGISPFYYNDVLFGAITILYSQAVVKDNTMHMVKILAWISFISILIVVSIAFFLTRNFIEPIISLRDAMKRIRKGKLGEQVKVKTRDEIGDLAKNFNEMSNDLASSYKEIESKNIDLAQAEKEYRDIFDNATEGIFQFRLDGQLLKANSALAAMLGYESAKDMIEQSENSIAVIYPDIEDRDRLVEILNSNGTVENYEISWQSKDGKIIQVSLNAREMSNEQGPYIEGTAVDITQRKNDIAALKKQEKELRKHREHLEEEVRKRTHTIDQELASRKKAENRITQWSYLQRALLDTRSLSEKLKSITNGLVDIFAADFARIWVVGPGDLCEKGCTHADLEQDRQKICKDRSSCLHLLASSGRYTHLDGAHGRIPLGAFKIGRLVESGHENFLTNDVVHDPQIADKKWASQLGLISFAGYGLFTSDGLPVGVMAIFSKQIITQQKENHLKGVAAMTSQVIKAGLAEKALVVAKQEAETATIVKSDFLARMSHEIRTPMNAVIGLTHLALRTDLSPKQHDYLRKIRGSSQALLGIINDILDFSKVEAGKLSLENILFRFQDVLDNLSNVVIVKSEEKGLEILYDLDRNIPGILKGDPLRLGQILINLVGNAIKFTEKGEVVISTRLIGRKDNKATIQFSVRDTGIGISENHIDELFNSFSQADGSITRRYGGTGLGLAIAKQLVEMMEGTLEVESCLGKGTTFSFAIDIEKEMEEIKRSDLLAIESFHGKTVLVVDDNKTSRHILKTILEDFSFQVYTAQSGYEAIELVENRLKDGKNQFSLILMDWKMPEIDGIETARQIKSDHRFTRSPSILMVTAYGRDEVMKEAEMAGLDGFLTKPVGPSILLDTIVDLFDSAGMHKAENKKGSNIINKKLIDMRGANILLVEDNSINRQVARELLEQFELNVDIAVNGVEGVQKACNKNYDLIFMDIQMPEMDGLKATGKIREKGLKELPIVAMTAHAMVKDLELSIAAGMNDHLTKPIDPLELEAILLKWITPINQILPMTKKPHNLDDKKFILPSVTGLDTETGVKHVGGSKSLYLELLEEFIDNNSDITAQIHKEITQKQWDAAERKAHSIKGTSSTLGAKSLSSAADLLEKALRNKDMNGAATLFSDFNSQLTLLLNELHVFFKSKKPVKLPVPDKKGSLKTALRTIKKLTSYIKEGNSQAEDIANELRQNLIGFKMKKELDALIKSIEDVEFETAQALIKRIYDHIRRDL